ncbi:MAG TPA: hypothetical protein VKT28_20735 [Puia sp.]|nr:hypothetical protein [Puia sp.]
MQKKRKVFLWVILLCLIIFGIWSYSLFSRKHESAANLKADITINAADLYNQYALNEADADKKFLNKIIMVKGKISEATNNGKAQSFLLDKISAGGVSCQMSADEEKKYAAIPADSIIIIKGKCTGFLIDVNLVDCVMQ